LEISVSSKPLRSVQGLSNLFLWERSREVDLVQAKANLIRLDQLLKAAEDLRLLKSESKKAAIKQEKSKHKSTSTPSLEWGAVVQVL